MWMFALVFLAAAGLVSGLMRSFFLLAGALRNLFPGDKPTESIEDIWVPDNEERAIT